MSEPMSAASGMAALAALERESLLHIWVEAIMLRSPLDRLSERPLAELVDQLGMLLDVVTKAGGAELSDRAGSSAAAAGGTLSEELERGLAAYDRFGHPFSLILLAVHSPSEAAPVGPGTFAEPRLDAAARAYAERLTPQLRTLDRVVPGPDAGQTALVLSAATPEAALTAATRIAAEVGVREWAVASCPADGLDSGALLAAAQERLAVARAERRETA